MRIGIEAQRLFRPCKRGMDIYALELIKNLQQLDSQNEYFIFVRPDEDSSCIEPSDNFNIVPLTAYCYADWEQVTLPKAAARCKLDVLHCTANTAPLYGVKSLVTTVHDVIFLEEEYLKQKYKGSWYQRFGNMYRKWLVPRVVGLSNRVITVSNFQKERIVHKTGADQDKVSVIYNGVASCFFDQPAAATTSQVRARHQLPASYFFFMGNTDPRKNLKGVLSAYNLVWHQKKVMHQQIPFLVMNGINHDYLQGMLDGLDIPNEVRNYIHLLGYISREDLIAIYSGATAFLFPSFSEGFGIPIIEAMASGVPVITSQTTSMPEIAGDAALLIDPSNKEGLAEAMGRVLNCSNLVRDLVLRGRQRATEFSWALTARQTLDIYQTYK